MPVPTSTTPSHSAMRRIEPAREEVEGHRPRRDEEDEDPDRPVVDPVIELVAVADLPVGVALDEDGVGLDRSVSGCWTCGRCRRRPWRRAAQNTLLTRPATRLGQRLGRALAHDAALLEQQHPVGAGADEVARRGSRPRWSGRPRRARAPCGPARRAVRGSSDAVGSSSSSSGGSMASARAIATRCASPPESSCGLASARAPTPSSSSRRRAVRSAVVAPVAADVHRRQPHVVRGGEVREQVVELEDHADARVQLAQRGAARQRPGPATRAPPSRSRRP